MELCIKFCKKCLVGLTNKNVAWKNKTQWRGICKKCRVKDVVEYQKKNIESARKRGERHRRKIGIGCLYPCLVCDTKVKRKGSPHVCGIRCKFFYYIQTVGECWEWKGAKSIAGYGKTSKLGKTMVASRLSYEIFKGPIPDGMKVCHTCDNPSCVNPVHLWLGTNQDNMTDMVKKGRSCRGESHRMAKMTENEIKELRNLYRKGERTIDLAEKYNLRPGSIANIVNYNTWKHI